MRNNERFVQEKQAFFVQKALREAILCVKMKKKVGK